jgi:thiazole synthase ThiGH ThiG subunit
MVNIYMGDEVITVREAVRNVQKNIQQIKLKLSPNTHGYPAEKAVNYYQAKLATQKMTLSWLKSILK